MASTASSTSIFPLILRLSPRQSARECRSPMSTSAAASVLLLIMSGSRAISKGYLWLVGGQGTGIRPPRAYQGLRRLCEAYRLQAGLINSKRSPAPTQNRAHAVAIGATGRIETPAAIAFERVIWQDKRVAEVAQKFCSGLLPPWSSSSGSFCKSNITETPTCRDRPKSEEMINERARPVRNLAIAAAFAMVLGACETTGSQQAVLQEPGGCPGNAGDYPWLIKLWAVGCGVLARTPKTGHGLNLRLI